MAPSHIVRAWVWALAIAGLLVLADSARAQTLDPTQSGRLFIVAIPDTVGNVIDPRYPSPLRDTFALHIYSDVDNVCTITGNGGYRRDVTLAAGRFTTIWLDDAENASTDITVREVGVPSRSTFRVEAREPIHLVCMIATRAGAEAWSPLPVERWGREHVALTMWGTIVKDVHVTGRFEFSLERRMAPAQILVTAAYDSTVVRLVRPRRIPLHPAPDDTSVVLMAGEACLFRTWVDTLMANDGIEQPDLSGTLILSSRPVGAVSGNARWFADPYIGVTRNAQQGMVLEALVPVEQFGTEFVAMPAQDSRRRTGAPTEDPAYRRRGEHVRVVTSPREPARIERLRAGAVAAVDSLVPGDVHAALLEFSLFAQVIRTSAPAQAVLVPEQAVESDGVTRDTAHWWPSIYRTWSGWSVELTPREQWVSLAPIITPSYPDSMEHHVNVVADSTDAPHIVWNDGTPFPFTRRIEATTLVWGSAPLAPGSQDRLYARNSGRFAGMVHGIRKGAEEYIPPNSAGDTEIYREITGLSYGYPLAPARRALREPSSVGAPRESARAAIAARVGDGDVLVDYSIVRGGSVELQLVDVTGRVVASRVEGDRSAGLHAASLRAEALPRGAYFVRLVVDGRDAGAVIVVAPR